MFLFGAFERVVNIHTVGTCEPEGMVTFVLFLGVRTAVYTKYTVELQVRKLEFIVWQSRERRQMMLYTARGTCAWTKIMNDLNDYYQTWFSIYDTRTVDCCCFAPMKQTLFSSIVYTVQIVRYILLMCFRPAEDHTSLHLQLAGIHNMDKLMKL